MTRPATTFERRHPDGSPVDRREPSDHEPSARTWCSTCGGPLEAGVCPIHRSRR